MAVVCRKCHEDVTEDFEAFPPGKPFRCPCGSATFLHQVDDPTVPYELTANDRRFLKRLTIREV